MSPPRGGSLLHSIYADARSIDAVACFKGQALKRYCTHNMEVQREVPEDRLLVLDIVGGDGWEVLCPFLGLPIPHQPFPHSNKTAKKV